MWPRLSGTLVLLAVCSVAWAAPAEAPEGVVSIEPPASLGVLEWYDAVPFSHEVHHDQGCVFCHHEAPSSGFGKCSDCHDQRENPEVAVHFFSAFHGAAERSCYACHVNRQQQGLATGPTGCRYGCHVQPDN